MNDSMTLSVPANTSGEATITKSRHPVKDARGWRLQQLQHDWRMLASEWLALAEALEQFEQEFGQLEENLNHRWERRAGINDGTRLTAAISVSIANDTNQPTTCDSNQKL